MDLLANYDDDNTEDTSISESPKRREINNTSNQSSLMLENEWLSFEQMIATGGSSSSDVVNSTDFLVNGIVAYPGMKGASTSGQGNHSKTRSDDESSASNNSDTEDKFEDSGKKEGKGEDDDAFFRLRKQVKERDRSTSSDRSGSSGSSSRSSSRSKSPSPPHLSPVTSIKSHTSEPPDLTETDVTETETTGVPEEVEEKEVIVEVSLEAKKRSKSRERRRSRSRDRKRSHREHRSKHDHSSRSKRRRSSRSRSRDRKRRRSRDRHRHKKSRDRSSKNDEKRSKSKERKESTSEATKSDGIVRKDSTKNENIEEVDKKSGKVDSKIEGVDNKSEGRDRKDSARSASRHSDSEKTEAKQSASGESKDKDTKSDSHRKRSRSRSKDRKKDKKRSRSRHRHRSKSKDRKERRRSKSKERKRSRSKDRKKKHRSRSKERRSRSRHRSKERHSRSRSRERLRSRSPVLGRKLTFKEQMRKEFINASKEMSHDNKIVTSLDALRKPGEALRPSDLLKGVKLTSGESVTPQMALIQTMAAMHKKAQELTGVEVPKYYNPAAVNPIKYAEQVQKRKLLWSKKPEEKDKTKNEQMETQWKSAFASSDDNKTASKFRKLMGMKEGDGPINLENLPEEFQKLTEEQKRKQAELFQRLDQEYQFARMTTHTQRGVGLGFATTVIDPNHPHSQNPP